MSKDDDTLVSDRARPTEQALPDLLAGRYRIVRWLGGGGMGAVYEVRDHELDERVALKVLRLGLSDDAIDRFRREVRLTRRIQHRNVARMFDIGAHDDHRFLTMELVDGMPLSRALRAPMPWHRLRPIAVQIAEGLAAAHAAQIIHRDLKPENILLENDTDRIVITDFGIARTAQDDAVTQVGAIVGTPRYMAPEQLAGDPVETSADVFSLGVVLYELLTGVRPWSGDNPVAIAVAQATETLPPLPRDLPREVAGSIAAALSLDPTKRPTAGELVAALAIEGVAKPSAPAAATRLDRPIKPDDARAPRSSTIAVVPFECQAEDEYLADGLQDELIDLLSTTQQLRVRPAGVVRGRLLDPREIGRANEVDHVVSGALRRTPTGLRIVMRLVSVADGFQIWAHHAEPIDRNVLAVGRAVVPEIARALSKRAAPPADAPTDPRSVELYLRARAELRRFWGGHARVASGLLDQAYALSPQSPPIVAARALAAVTAWAFLNLPELRAHAVDTLHAAIATDHPEALLASAQFKLNTGDSLAAAGELGTALVRAPMLAQAHEMAGKLLVEMGATDEARRHLETAGQLDPGRVPILEMELARLEALLGKWASAERRVDQLIHDRDPALVQLATVFGARMGMWQGAEPAQSAMALFRDRLADAAGPLLGMIGRFAHNKALDSDALDKYLASRGPSSALRNEILGLQILAECAFTYSQDDMGYRALTLAEQRGLMDVFLLDACPVFDRVRHVAAFIQIRDAVAARAAQFLARYRMAAGDTGRVCD